MEELFIRHMQSLKGETVKAQMKKSGGKMFGKEMRPRHWKAIARTIGIQNAVRHIGQGSVTCNCHVKSRLSILALTYMGCGPVRHASLRGSEESEPQILPRID